MAVIVPHPNDFADVFNSLLEMGVPVNQIATTSDTEYLGLVVPDDVYERWVGADSTKEDAPAPKRRGRPPKNPAPEPVESSPVDEETTP